MIKRVQRYVDNAGMLNAVIILVLIGLFSWRLIQMSSVLAMVIFGGSALVMVLLSLAVMPYFVERPGQAAMVLRVGQYAFYVLIANAFLNFIPVSLGWNFLIVMGLYFYVGFGFWFLSSPRIVTPQGHAKVVDRYERREEAALREEIARNSRVIDEQNAG